MGSLVDFIENGFIGDIKLGMKRSEIESILGKAKDKSVSKTPTILKYKSMQLSFDSDHQESTLRSIHAYFTEDVEFPEKLNIEGWIPNPRMKLEVFMHEIGKLNITLLEDKKHTLKNDQIGFKSKSNVIIIFVNEGEKETLDSFHLSDF